METQKVKWYREHLDDSLETLIHEDNILNFDAQCVRKKSNISKSHDIYKFDNLNFNPELLLKDIPHVSPKLKTLLDKIEILDKEDMKKHGKLFKHFIFSDLKSNSAGIKLIASAMIAKKYDLGYIAEPLQGAVKTPPENTTKSNDSTPKMSPVAPPAETDEKQKNKKKFKKIELLTDTDLRKTKQNNFYLLTSVGLYDQNITVTMKKHILSTFNKRPDNINGDLCRFILMDSGFKEGIDLFDIKYIHIFEPSVVSADQKQVIGRGTRTCGQKGLQFHPTRGWPLHVFVYDLSIPDKLQPSMMGAKSAIELYLKAMNMDIRLLNFAHELEKTSVFGSVDYELNKNIHSFSIPNDEDEEELPPGSEFIYGGTKEPKVRLKIRDGPPILLPSKPSTENNIILPNGVILATQPTERLKFHDLRKHIREHFADFTWDNVKMENLCADKTTGGAGDVIKYTPTQDFIRHYFTPQNPVKGLLLHHSVGTGKCHAKDTPIILYDGSIKMVQDIKIGDLLMGDDSTPRKVLSLATGVDDLYDIIPVKGDKYTVNSEHILCLKPTNLGIKHDKNNKTNPYQAIYINKTGKVSCNKFKNIEDAQLFMNEIQKDNIVEIPVNDYLKLPVNSKKNLKGYKVDVEFPYKDVLFDPYIIGYWLGDGSQRDPVISTQDSTVLYYLFKELPKQNLLLNYQSGYDYRITGIKGVNPFLKSLQYYNLINNKHIPNDYKINDRETRLQILAGLLDSDGYCDNKCYEITQKNKILADDILFLCRSLGFAAYMTECSKSCMYKGEKKTGTYYRINISGNELYNIPVKIQRKKAFQRLQKKNVLVTGITVKNIGKGDYFGFTLDGNNRYLLGDFTVTHNTCSAIAAATSSFEKQGYTILWVTRTTLKSDIWKNMFEQVCNEDIREKIVNNGLVIPDDNKKRIRLVSKAWRIRPMSYKQFSNLVSKQNAFYKTLVKINGDVDPLRKTLLIIDEAHKLYGGGDLSTIERPDMTALHQSLMNSYQISGADSVKLLLMTATPVTQDPMELIKLMNLCKLSSEQMPTEFTEFSEKYLDDEGNFTKKGEEQYLEDIAGHISYLNREKDARQFAQPIIQHIDVPITDNIEEIEKFDKKEVRRYMESDITELKKKIEENNKELQGEVDEIDTNSFNYLYKKCDGLEEPQKKKCEKVVRQNIKDLVHEAKADVDKIKKDIKDLREELKNKNLLKKTHLSTVADNMDKLKPEYEKYKGSLYYNVKTNCGKTIKSTSHLKEEIKEHPTVILFDKQIDDYNNRIAELQNNLKNDMNNYKNRIKQIRLLLKTDLNDLEKSVVRMTIKQEQKTMKHLLKEKTKETTATIDEIKQSIKKTQKRRDKKYKKIRNTIKQIISDERREAKQEKAHEKKLRKTLRKTGEYSEFKDNRIKNLVDTYANLIDKDLEEMDKKEMEAALEKKEAKEAKQREKEQEKAHKKAEKEREKSEKRATKKAEKEREKEAKKKAKQDAKMAEREARKTKKNKK